MPDEPSPEKYIEIFKLHEALQAGISGGTQQIFTVLREIQDLMPKTPLLDSNNTLARLAALMSDPMLMNALLLAGQVSPTPPPAFKMAGYHRCPLPWVVDQLRSLLHGEVTVSSLQKAIQHIIDEIYGSK